MEGARRRGRLPNPLTSLVGRELDVREVERLLDEHRLVTLTGAGGSGKTRVAIAVASRARGSQPDGVTFVGLEDIHHREGAVLAVADSLGIAERAGTDLVATIESYLADRRLLLVLDNFEQILPAAPLVSGFLEAAPDVHIIVTSRAPLRIAGEHEWEVLPLDADSAFRIFVQRATAVRPAFDAAAHGAAIGAIVRLVDGLPLAVELAAAQVRHLTPETIHARLDGSLSALQGGQRDVPARHRTQRATLDWSHELLSPSTARLFASLSDFAGGWTLEAAERVCAEDQGGTAAVLAGLAELVESSLVRVEENPLGLRYSMHQLTREYATERLAAGGGQRGVDRRHAEWVLDLVETAEPHLVLRDLRAWQERLRTEEDNIRRALGWVIDQREPQLGMRIVGFLWRFWFHWATSREGIGWLEAVLALPGARAVGVPRARALSSLAALWWHQGRFAQCLDAYLEVVAILRSLGVEDERLGDTLDDAAWAAGLKGDADLTMRLVEEKWRCPRPARSHRFDGWLTEQEDLAFWRLENDHPSADAAFVVDAMEGILEEVDLSDQALFAAHVRANICSLQFEHRLGDLGFQHERDAMRLYRDLGHRGQMPIMLLGMAHTELMLGRPERALRLGAAAGRESAAVGGTVISQDDWAGIADTDVRAAALLPADEVARALREGRAMTTDEAVAYALHELPEETVVRTHRGRHDLTAREQEVLVLVADGRTDGEIAEALVISKKTASVHVASIKGKLGAGSRAEIVSLALRGGIVRDA